MSHWIESIENHPAFNELNEFSVILDLSKDACSKEKILMDNWERAVAVTVHARKVLDQADPLIVSTGTLNNISSTLHQARAEINNFIATSNHGYWNNIQAQLDSCLVHVAAVPTQSQNGIEGMRESASNYRRSVANLLEAIKRDGEGISKLQADLQNRINDSSSEITNQKQRLDTAISTFQQQFSDAQQTRQTEFSLAEQARTTAAQDSESIRQSSFEDFRKKREDLEKHATEAAKENHESLVKDLKSNAEIIINTIEQQKIHAQKIVGIISNTGMAHGFQVNANNERDEAKTWKSVAALSLIAWIIIGGIFFALTYDKDLTFAAVARQFLLSTPFVLLSGFAALQVTRHQKNERKMRQAELEIASIDPFLATLSDDDRNEVKREFASRYFGQKEDEHKHEASHSNLVPLTEILAKIVQELTKK